MPPARELVRTPLSPSQQRAELTKHRLLTCAALKDSARYGAATVTEDALFGYRAAGPALLSNLSYFERKICRWDPEAMKLL